MVGILRNLFDTLNKHVIQLHGAVVYLGTNIMAFYKEKHYGHITSRNSR
jgi:hypothetical protein